jgi:hypothetical protein|tara:strand:- start:78 stop:302 length:225 start_codon:yes stop_codon:yes gene_type:complete
MKSDELIKNDWYIINNGLGNPVRAKLVESAKQGRGYKNAVLMDVIGSDAGLYDETGSVYVKDIIKKYKKGEKLK